MTRCPVCRGASRFAFATPDRNRGIGSETFTYRACETCGTLFLEDVPADLGRYYPDEYYVLPSLDDLRRQGRAESYRMDFVLPYAAAGRLVEVGPGHGIFAIQAKDAGFETTAIEMDERAGRYLRETVGIKVVTSDRPAEVLAGLPPSRVVALWHVLEHLRDPAQTLEAVAANLEPGGIVVIAVPNPRAFGFRVLGGRWPHVDAPRHLALIPARTLIDRAAGHGLELATLDSDDPGARHWNRFGWQFALRSPHAGFVGNGLALLAGRLIAAPLSAVERRPGRGATYTAVFRKPAAVV